MTTTATEHQTPPTPPAWEPRWAPRRVIMLAFAAFLLLGAAASVAGAAWLVSVEDDRREDGYLTTDTRHLESQGHALTIEEIDLDGLNGDWLLGEARLRATGSDPDATVFVGIARSDDAADYLRDVEHSAVTELDDQRAEYDERAGGAPSAGPTDLDIWVAQSSGPGAQSVVWTPEDGEWTAVIMNVDGSAGVDVRTDVGATVPVLDKVVDGLWIGGAVFAFSGAALAVAGLVRSKRA